MRCILTAVWFATLLLSSTWPTADVVAQQRPAPPQGKAAELVQLWESLQHPHAPSQQIALADRALRLEREIGRWPLKVSRDEARGFLWWRSAIGHAELSEGDSAENQERAIAAFKKAAALLVGKRAAQKRASVQYGLGTAYLNRLRGDKTDNLEKAIAAHEAALTLFTREATPSEWALAQSGLGDAHRSRLRGDRADNLERAIAAYEAALAVMTREATPIGWATTMHSLGNAYGDRVRGDKADNLEKSIAYLEAALLVITRVEAPANWARGQVNLAIAYSNRIGGNKADNMEVAISAYESALTVLTREVAPVEWAITQGNVGTAYTERVRGDRADNLERAIEAHEAALTIESRETMPYQWGTTQNNLGGAYFQRIRGEKADNIERAIAAFDAALTVRSPESQPYHWATTQNNLGAAYEKRIRGNRSENVEKAIAAHKSALTVRTREAMPFDWAVAQQNLGIAYTNRVEGDPAENMDKAIAAFEAALTVRTRAALPYEWALTQMNLGGAYWRRIRGDRADNQEKVIGAYASALTVVNREAFPIEWAGTQFSLALTYLDRVRGDRADNLRKAIAACEAALTVRTLKGMPHEHMLAARLLGGVLSQSGEWDKASEAYGSAREAFLLLFGQGLNDHDARNLISQAGSLFADAAFAAAQLGEDERVFALATEGRARLMAVALKLTTLDLSADKRQRLDELRAEIRIADRGVEAAQGTERAAALGKLVSRRQELLSLVTSADAAGVSALAQARTLAGEGGAVVVPIVTKLGGKLLLVTDGPSKGSGRQGLTAINLPDLTTDKVDVLIRGDGRDGKAGGWLGAYNINYLDEAEHNRRWREWTSAIDNLGPQLWHLFGAQLDAALKDAGIKPGARIVWLPTGALGILPLGLVQDPGTGLRLVDGYEIVYASSLESLAVAQKEIAKGTTSALATLAAVVNPTGDLEGSEKEGKIVASHFPDQARTVLERAQASPEAVLAALKGKTHWHFASHGTFSWRDARQSALVMHGGKDLSVGSLLETDGLGRPRLVVLSACETGLYDIQSNPDEFIGLPGAFTALGATGVLGTLWPVSDAATALLIAKFYELHMGEGLAPPRALRQAQLWLRQASSADLEAYARGAAEQGRLESSHVAEIAADLSEVRLNRSRNAALFQWVTPDATRADAKTGSTSASNVARVYAHPYFWAGFVYTGL
jgi:CHAT domain-containing protein/tetratricopeptide (TPR) repeat protein